MEEYSSKKRVRDDTDSLRFDSPEVKRIRDDLLDSFDDDGDIYAPPSHELDSFMKSFAEEIAVVTELTSDSGEAQPEFGYLLGAFDGELDLPSTSKEEEEEEDGKKTELGRVEYNSSVLGGGGGFWGLEEEGIPGFDPFAIGSFDAGNDNNEYVELDRLFDYADLGFGSSDLLWRPDTLPAK